MAFIPVKRQSKDLVGYNPFRQMENLQRRMLNVFPFANLPDEEDFMDSGWVPAVDVANLKDKITVRAELPGIKKEDLNVSIDHDTLTISGEKKQDSEQKQEDYIRTERVYGYFSRSFTLPAGVDAQNIKATFKEGILELNLPKKEEAKSKHQKINIQ